MHGAFASGLFNISLSSVINFSLIWEQKKGINNEEQDKEKWFREKMYQALFLISKEQLTVPPSLFNPPDKLCICVYEMLQVGRSDERRHFNGSAALNPRWDDSIA